MQYSFSTLAMAVIATNLLIVLLAFCFLNTKVMINAGYKLLALFIIFSVLRVILPFELPFTITIYRGGSLATAIWQLFPPVTEIAGHSLSLWRIFEGIWLSGIIINMLRYVFSYIKSKRYIILHQKVVTTKEPFASLIAKICGEQYKPNKFTILELPGIEIPVLYGIFTPNILIPEKMDLSEEDWYYVLRHETSHHFHHDILMKNIIKIITIIYWWNPFCILLNRQTDVILEMRIDDSITLRNYETTDSYIKCLINVSEQQQKIKPVSKTFTMSLLPTEISDMGKRIHMLTANQKKRNIASNIFLAALGLTIYILSYVFIVEAFDNPEDPDAFPYDVYDKMVMPSLGDFYAVQKTDDTYDIYINGTYMETVDSLEYYIDIDVIPEDEYFP